MKYIALICARGGSKGLPGKNIRLLDGVPLIGWSIIAARKVDRISRVIVSTDSMEIAKVAQEYGAEVPFMRPAELAEDDSPEWLVWRHAIKYLLQRGDELDGLVVLPATAPLRSVEDVENVLNEFEHGSVDTVITVTDAHRSPFFNMVKEDADGYLGVVILGQKSIYRRQDAPVVFDVTTVAYAVRPSFVLEKEGIFCGRVRGVHVPVERSIDIDTKFDFGLAEYIVSQRNGN